MRKYELVVLLKASVTEEELEKITKKLLSYIEAAKGTAVTSSVLGKKPMAYAIKKNSEANYVLFNFEIEPLAAKEVETKFRQDENVIRHLLVRKD